MEQAERENEIVSDIKAALPDFIVPAEEFYYGCNNYLNDLTVTTEEMEFHDAMALVEKSNPQMVTLARDGFAAFVPEGRWEKFMEEHPNAQDTGAVCNCCIYEVDGLRQYGDEHRITFFYRMRGPLCKG